MRKIITLIVMVSLTIGALFAQTNRMSYQAVVRNANNELVYNENVSVQVEILNASGVVQYSERHTTTTNANGMLSLTIGGGTHVEGTFADVVWQNAVIRSVFTLADGATVTQTTPVTAVPYAMYAENAGNAFSGDYNDLENRPPIPTVPEDVSAFNNDAGYITVVDIPDETDPTVPSWAKAETKPTYDYSEIENTPQIPQVPEDVSVFNNDAGYITAADIPAIPTVPADVSAFNNDAHYITNTNTSCADAVDLCELLEKLELLENQLEPIMIQTEGVTAVTTTSFTVNGKVLTDGSSTVTERGFVYSTGHNPTLNDSKTTSGSGTGSFTSTIESLTSGTTYYVRAYATNSNGSYYGSEVAVTTTATTPSTTPSVTTMAVTNITTSEATVKGAVTSDGGENVTQRGFVYGTQPNPTLDSQVANHGTGVGQYSNLLTSLLSGETYYIRAFAKNSVGVAYGNELTFVTSLPTPVAGDAVPCPNAPTVTDHEGNVYNTVKIGTQCWTKENIRTTTSPTTGTYLIPPAGTTVTYTGKQARWYDDDSATYAPKNYGLLYNWNAAVDTFNLSYGEISVNPNQNTKAVNVLFSGHRRGICPIGWHVPSDEEWTILTDYLNAHEEYRSGGFDGYIAKALASTNEWGNSAILYSPGNNSSGNNVSGYNALPTGKHSGYYYVGSELSAFFWSSTQFTYPSSGSYPYESYLRYIDNQTVNNAPYVISYRYEKFQCHSVRCLKDDPNSANPVNPTGGGTTTNGVPCPNDPTVTDVDGNVYNTVKIGDQCWMKENLKTTKYSDNTDIIQEGDASSMTGHWYYPNNNESNKSAYGLLYNWVAIMHGASSSSSNPSSVQGICPTGWHVPSDAEWTQLTDYVGSVPEYLCGNNSSDIAKALASKEEWSSSDAGCRVGNNMSTNNATGFNALPAGGYNWDQYDFGSVTFFWTATQSTDNLSPIFRIISSGETDVRKNDFGSTDARSVRCLRD